MIIQLTIQTISVIIILIAIEYLSIDVNDFRKERGTFNEENTKTFNY